MLNSAIESKYLYEGFSDFECGVIIVAGIGLFFMIKKCGFFE